MRSLTESRVRTRRHWVEDRLHFSIIMDKIADVVDIVSVPARDFDFATSPGERASGPLRLKAPSRVPGTMLTKAAKLAKRLSSAAQLFGQRGALRARLGRGAGRTGRGGLCEGGTMEGVI